PGGLRRDGAHRREGAGRFLRSGGQGIRRRPQALRELDHDRLARRAAQARQGSVRGDDGGRGGADAIIEKKGLRQITDTGAIEKAIDEVLAKNPGQLAQYRAGKEALFGFFVGQTMKATGDKANPAELNRLLKEKLKG